MRQLLVELLKQDHRAVLVAATAADALEVAREHAPIEVALVEKALSDRSGLELTRELKAVDPATEIILMSSSPSLEAVLEAVEAGASDFLPKPFEDIQQVAVRIGSAEEQARLRRERARLHLALVESEERYRKLFEATPDAVLVYDESTGRVEDANSAALALYGYCKDELAGLQVTRLRADAWEPAEDGLESTRAAGVVHRKDVNQEGRSLDVEVVSGRFQARGRNMVVEIVRDLGDRLRAERAHRELEERLRQSQKTEALGRLAAGIAHDFNNLLTVIQNYADFVAQTLREAPEIATVAAIREDVEQILLASSSATSLTRQLLAFSRRELVQPRAVNPKEVVEGVEKLLRHTLGRHVELEVRSAGEILPIKVDQGQLEQVLVNLAVNARDAMPGGGNLTILTRTVPGGVHPSDPSAGWVVIEVRDTGQGIAPEILDKVFDPFFTTKEGDKGTGLGLATVKGIVEQAGGHIEVSTVLGAGTTFRVYFPATAPESESHRGSGRPAPGAPGGRLILVVDDEDALRRAICRMLKRAGYTVLAARSGPEALAEHERQSGRLDLVITDLIMSGMSGEALVSALRARQPGLKAVFITGFAASATLDHIGGGQERAVLPKPFTERRLLDFVHEVLDGSAEPA